MENRYTFTSSANMYQIRDRMISLCYDIQGQLKDYLPSSDEYKIMIDKLSVITDLLMSITEVKPDDNEI